MRKSSFEDSYERFMDKIRGNDFVYRYYRRAVRLDRVRHTDGIDYLVRYETLLGISPASNTWTFEMSENIDTHVEPIITERIVVTEGEESFTTAPAEQQTAILVYDTPFTEDSVIDALKTATWIKCKDCMKAFHVEDELAAHSETAHTHSYNKDGIVQDPWSVNNVTLNVRYSDASAQYIAPSLKHFINATFEDLWEFGKTGRIGVFDKSQEGQLVSQLTALPEKDLTVLLDQVKSSRKQVDNSRRRVITQNASNQ